MSTDPDTPAPAALWTVHPADEAAREREETVAAFVSAVAHRYDVYAEHAVRLIDKTLLIYDDTGRPRNVLQAMDALVRQYPWIVGKYPPTEAELAAEHAANYVRPMSQERRRRITNAGQLQRATSRMPR